VAWRLAVVGVGTGLATGPIVTLAMGLPPPALMATVGASTSLARSLGFAVGPALAIGAWALADYRLAGMRAIAALAVAVTVLGAVALAGGRKRAQQPELEEVAA
jgi:energy-converting hydrogenase Eha subunit A